MYKTKWRSPGNAIDTKHSPPEAPKEGENNIRTVHVKSRHSTLRKHAYLSILKILPSKNENLQIKNSDILHISAQNIDCGYSNEYPQSMVLSKNKKNIVYPYKPQFYYIKVGFKGVKII